MFEKAVALLLLAAIQANTHPNIVPFALIDEANSKLTALRQIVLGAIAVADFNLEDFYLDLEIYGNTTSLQAMVTIETEALSIHQQLNNIKNLAISANADISYCLQGREDYLKQLPDVILEELSQCIAEKTEEGAHILSSYKYLVDITINRVDALDFQLGLCHPDSSECISPIIEKIDVDTVQLPQEIEVQVTRASELFDEVKVIVDGCSDLKVSQYISSTTTILNVIIQCANDIIG